MGENNEPLPPGVPSVPSYIPNSVESVKMSTSYPQSFQNNVNPHHQYQYLYNSHSVVPPSNVALAPQRINPHFNSSPRLDPTQYSLSFSNQFAGNFQNNNFSQYGPHTVQNFQQPPGSVMSTCTTHASPLTSNVSQPQSANVLDGNQNKDLEQNALQSAQNTLEEEPPKLYETDSRLEVPSDDIENAVRDAVLREQETAVQKVIHGQREWRGATEPPEDHGDIIAKRHDQNAIKEHLLKMTTKHRADMASKRGRTSIAEQGNSEIGNGYGVPGGGAYLGASVPNIVSPTGVKILEQDVRSEKRESKLPEYLKLKLRARGILKYEEAKTPPQTPQNLTPKNLPPEWIEACDPASGSLYYYNQKSGKSQWERPVEASLNSEPPSSSPLPTDWQVLFDETTGKNYYYNTKTFVTQWEQPGFSHHVPFVNHDTEVSGKEANENHGDQPSAFKKLCSEVWLVAHALETLELEKGSAIAIDMPMDVNSVVIYLAIVLAGYVVVSIADSFASTEISTRLTLSKAKAIFTQDFIVRGDRRLPLYSRVIDAQSPTAIVIPTKDSSFSTMLREGDISWHDFLKRVQRFKEVEYVAVERPVESFTNILFSSGTTGEPKAIPWTLATPLKAAADGWCHMDIRKGDVVAWPTNLGWMMGPWLVYAPLLNGASIALYNGVPLSSGFAKFVQDAEVTMLGVIPSIVRTWRTTNCTDGYDWSAIRCFGSTGEASNVDEYLWLMGRANYKPVIEYCGGTEIGGGFVTGSLLQRQSLAAFSTPAMGCSLFIIDNDGIPIPPNVPGIGELALHPFIFGSSSTLLNGNHYKVYFKDMPAWHGKILRRHGDMFERTSSGYYHAHGRADDTMNLGGIKVSSVEIERITNAVDDSVHETAAIGVPPQGGGPERLVIAVVFKDSNVSTPDLDRLRVSFNSALQKKLNPLFKVSHIVPISSLPRTATNKVMRRILRQNFTKIDHNSKL